MAKFSLVRVARKLEGLGYDRQEIADVFGQHPSGISRILKGYDLDAFFVRVAHIADKLEVSMDEVRRMGTEESYVPELPKPTQGKTAASEQVALAGV